MWWKAYGSLDLFGGKIAFIGDDLEDMIEISYTDGMMIDVGKSDEDGIYYITVVASNDREGWSDPLLELPVPNKGDLLDRIQEVINRFRSSK